MAGFFFNYRGARLSLDKNDLRFVSRQYIGFIRRLSLMLNLLVCPKTSKPLKLSEDGLRLAGPDSAYRIENGVPLLYVGESDSVTKSQIESEQKDDVVTNTVKGFYEESPFPNYNDFDTLSSFVMQANKGVFAKMLGEQIPPNSTVLEVGCGTGQLSNFLAATTASRYCAADMSSASLSLGRSFSDKNNIHGVQFTQMNLFRPCFAPETFDIVISNGVLHHTYDTKKAFMSISRLVKPGGHIIIGLYNHIGRLRTDLRRILVRSIGEWTLFLDPHLRNELSAPKRRAWIEDQYYHPQEREHSFSEVLDWFDEAGFSFVSSIPKINGIFRREEDLFSDQDPGSVIDRFYAETRMLFSHYGGEGGLFLCIGRKNLD